MIFITAQFDTETFGMRAAQEDFLRFHKIVRLAFPHFEVISKGEINDGDSGDVLLQLSFSTRANDEEVARIIDDLDDKFTEYETLLSVTVLPSDEN